MKKIAVAGLLAAAMVPVAGHAEEGMWQPHQLPALKGDLKRLGLKTQPRRLTDLTAFPMNAVISLRNCTASFVSPQGLVVTNHHCAYGSIQYNATDERNLLATGFLAETPADELPAAPGSRVLVTVAVDQVTDAIVGDLAADLSGRQRYQAIEDRRKAMVAACEEDAGHRCQVASFHGGLEYYLIKQLEIRDVRLAYAPAEAIGKFGGDIDNWQWPRHTGDFTFYRAYVGPDGKPADHAPDNVPYQPRHHLTVSTEGVSDGDFVMVAGYPGRTQRYRRLSEVESAFDWRYPVFRELIGRWIDTIETATVDDPDAAIKYASFLASLNNAAKNFDGQMEGAARVGLTDRRRQREAELDAWIAADPDRQRRYAAAIADLDALIAGQIATRERDFYTGRLGRTQALATARQLYRLAHERQKPDAEREPGYQDRDMAFFTEAMKRMERRYAPAVDRAVLALFVGEYAKLPADRRIPAFDAALGIGDTLDTAALDATLGAMYAGTGLGDTDTRLAWMDKSVADFKASDDPFIQLAVALFDHDMAREEEDKARAGRFQQLRPKYMEAIIAFNEARGRPVYADANSTLRVTYGTVTGVSPRDGLVYEPFTTLDGIVEKYTGQDPFDSPAGQLDAIAAGDYGRYADPALDSVPVNFLSTLDVTGGNSGSPTLNGRAELVGLLFDGTYESINSDWDFDVKTTRSIHVDSRYMLWVMDKVDGAHTLLREMGIEPSTAQRAAAE